MRTSLKSAASLESKGEPLLACELVDKVLLRIQRTGLCKLPEDIRDHLDECQACWRKWVAVRWTLSSNSVELFELQQFLGSQYQYGVDSSWKLAGEWNARPRKEDSEIEEFYRTTPWYVYNLVVWKASGQRPNYVEKARPVLEKWNVTSVIDFGAGVGNDALEFAKLGYNIVAYEFDNLASQFLKWRAARRGLKITYVDAGSSGALGQAAAAVDGTVLLWAMDVIEHLRDPICLLGPLLLRADMLIYDSEHTGTSGGRHPFHFPHDRDALLGQLARLGLTSDYNASELTDLNVLVKRPAS